MKLLKRTWADVSLDNLSHNYKMLRSLVPSSCRFLGVVKADAYGHGAIPISRQLKDLGADYLAVSNLEEAVQIRRGDIRLPILILGYTPPVYAEDMADMGIEIYSPTEEEYDTMKTYFKENVWPKYENTLDKAVYDSLLANGLTGPAE